MMLRTPILVVLVVLLFAGNAEAQTQDWAGVPQPGNDPQLQQLYAQALAQSQQQYAQIQQSMPAIAGGVPAQAAAWVKQSTILFDAKWNYWDSLHPNKLNPANWMTNNPQYLKDVQAWNQGCYPQCPNFGSSSNSPGGRSSKPTSPANTINSSLYGAAALSQGLVSPTAVAQREADAEAADLLSEVAAYAPSPGDGTLSQVRGSDDSLEYDGPRELDFNHPETLPDATPGVSVITFPAPNIDGTPGQVPCLTVLTCTPASSEIAPLPGNQTDAEGSVAASLEGSDATLVTQATATPGLLAPQVDPPPPMSDGTAPDSDGSNSPGLLSKIGNLIVPNAEADTTGPNSGGTTKPSPANNMANVTTGLVQQAASIAQNNVAAAQQATLNGQRELEQNLPLIIAGKMDETGLTLPWTASYGSSLEDVKDILSPPTAVPVTAGSFLKNLFTSAPVQDKAYDLSTAAAVNAAIAANPDQRAEIAFRAYILPNLLTPGKLVDNFGNFWGIVVDGKQAGEK